MNGLRKKAVAHMIKMASIKWTANMDFDYTEIGKTLKYNKGETYYGMLYNWTVTGLEKFEAALDDAGIYKLDDPDPDVAPGNTCATSVLHAWQEVSPSVQYEYTIDMMPCFEKTGVIAVGEVDWSGYDGKNTKNSVRDANDKNKVLEAFALVQPADAFTRYLDTGGHAYMVTLPPDVARFADGSIDVDKSFVYLTDQNNIINHFREFASSWKVHRQVSFRKMYDEGYLPVACKEIAAGDVIEPEYKLEMSGSEFTVSCNYCIKTVRVFNGETVVEDHPFTREYKGQAGFGSQITVICGAGEKIFNM